MKANECYRDLIVGISKVKDFKGTQYQFPTNFTQKLIPLIFKQFNLSENNETTNSIVFINRRNSRKIVNSKEIIETIRKQFPQYTINEYYFENMPMKEQIRVSSNAKILIGAHGSGISHLAWMKPNSTVIEIFPYLYICRNWYKKASVVSATRMCSYSGYETPSITCVRTKEFGSTRSSFKANSCITNPHVLSPTAAVINS